MKNNKMGLHQGILARFLSGERLLLDEYIILLDMLDDPDSMMLIREKAVSLRKKYYGRRVYVRGLIEFTNYCRNNCLYCGIRRDNRNAVRYRMTEEEILDCCRQGHGLGIQTFVLQGGEDPAWDPERMEGLIRKIKEEYPECALTLSFGEHSYETYARWKKAGADRYLLRHETADRDHYRFLHPEEMSLSRRMNCLRELKELGYQVGAGFMVCSPGQKPEHIAKDLAFLADLQPEMVGIGPFIPHHETEFADCQAGSATMTIRLLSVLRVLLPKVLLPATTALGTIDLLGREKGLEAGANVVMPNLSPTENRKNYDLYDNKVCVDDVAEKCYHCLEMRIRNAGYEMVKDRGDHVSLQ